MATDDKPSNFSTHGSITSIFKNKALQDTGSKVSSDLQEALERIKSLRGDNDTWLKRERAIGLFMADSLNKPMRIWSRGEWRAAHIHLPAVLVFNETSGTVEVWAPLHDTDALVQVELDYFHNTIPHAGIAQEVYGDHGTHGSSTI